MTNDNKLDDLKTKATELGEDLKLKAQAAKLEGEKVLEDVKHQATEAKLDAEKQLTDLKQNAAESKAEGDAAFEQKLESAQAKAEHAKQVA